MWFRFVILRLSPKEEKNEKFEEKNKDVQESLKYIEPISKQTKKFNCFYKFNKLVWGFLLFKYKCLNIRPKILFHKLLEAILGTVSFIYAPKWDTKHTDTILADIVLHGKTEIIFGARIQQDNSNAHVKGRQTDESTSYKLIIFSIWKWQC